MIDAFSQLVNDISPSTGGVYESARLNENLDGTGGITLSWNSATNTSIPVGTSVEWNDTKYMVLEPYAPQKASPTHYRYEVTFKHPLARLARVPFYIRSMESGGNPIDLHTATFTGYVQTIAQKLADFFSEYAELDAEFGETFGVWTVDLSQLSTPLLEAMITVNFDGCSIRSAATRIADALGCNVFFDWNVIEEKRTIRFISGTTIDGEYYNCFRVLGGTTNMAKKTVSGLYAAVTQRLTLDSSYNGSLMYRAINNNRPSVLLTRDLIFDNIFPKMELFIKSARPRFCYLTDEDGNKIVDHYEKNGSVVQVLTPSMLEGATPIYKLYCKWYVKLEYKDGTEYRHDSRIQIADKTMGLLFQPDYANTHISCPLAGREFEVVYFNSDTDEWEEDDVLQKTDPFRAELGEFRIVFGAEGETILPTLPISGQVPVLNYNLTNSSESATCPFLVGGGLVPKVGDTYNGETYKGNKVTLTNIAVDGVVGNVNYKAIAQNELRLAALEVIALMDNDNGQYQYQSIDGIPSIGTQQTTDGHTGVVTNISADLDTGVADITIGSWSRKTLTEGIRDKIDSVTATGSGETENDRVMSKGSFNTLMRTVKKTNVSQETINTLGTRIEEIAAQADAQFNVIFGIGDPTTAEQKPEDDWTDEEKEMHLQDIYYDMNREAASTGGRAWRWCFHAAGTSITTIVNGQSQTESFSVDTYRWEEITDKDTILSLEKIADVAGDGVLSGGAEKTRIFIEWKSAVDDMTKLLTEAANYGITVNANNNPQSEADLLVDAYWELWRVLNAGTAKTSSTTYNTTPSWLGDLTATSRFEGTSITPTIYKEAWNDFYSAFSTLSTAITGQTRTLVASKISYYASYNIPTPPYTAGAMWFKLASQNPGETNGVLYQCINSCSSGTGQMSDWKKVSNFGVSIGSMLATLYSHWEDKIKQIHDFSVDDVYDSIPVYIQNTEPTRTYPMVWFNPSYDNGNGIVNGMVTVRYDAWEDETITPSGHNNSDATLISLFTEIYNTLGEFTFNIWNYLSDGATLYDIFGKRSSFTDSFTQQTIEGQLSVWMKGDDAWTQVLDNTEGILQNYGDHIVAAIYGVDAETAATVSGGLSIAKNMAQMFVKAAQDVNGSSVMKTVAGINVVGATTDPITGRVTGGHVEIIGNLVTADERIELGIEDLGEYTDSDSISYNKVVGMTMYKKTEETNGVTGEVETTKTKCIEVSYNDYASVHGNGFLPIIQMYGRHYIRGKEIEGMVYIDTSRIRAGQYGIAKMKDTGGGFDYFDGVDGSFTTADGKTVTVMGGIITDIS